MISSASRTGVITTIRIMITTAQNNAAVGETKAVTTATQVTLAATEPVMEVMDNRACATKMGNNPPRQATAVTVTLEDFKVGMVINNRTKIITAAIRRPRGVVMACRKVANTAVTRTVGSRVITAATICVIATINNPTINTVVTRIISKIGISKPVSGSRMITADKKTGVILRSGSRAISKIDTVPAVTTINNTEIIHLISGVHPIG